MKQRELSLAQETSTDQLAETNQEASGGSRYVTRDPQDH